MRQRFFLIEPKYSDPDIFCSFIVGSDRVRASIQMYADLEMLRGVAEALSASSLATEAPFNPFVPEFPELADKDSLFDFFLTVLPHEGATRELRFRVFQDYLDDGAPYRTDIRFKLTPKEAEEFAQELRAWCAKPEYHFVWKAD